MIRSKVPPRSIKGIGHRLGWRFAQTRLPRLLRPITAAGSGLSPNQCRALPSASSHWSSRDRLVSGSSFRAWRQRTPIPSRGSAPAESSAVRAPREWPATTTRSPFSGRRWSFWACSTPARSCSRCSRALVPSKGCRPCSSACTAAASLPGCSRSATGQPPDATRRANQWKCSGFPPNPGMSASHIPSRRWSSGTQVSTWRGTARWGRRIWLLLYRKELWARDARFAGVSSVETNASRPRSRSNPWWRFNWRRQREDACTKASRSSRNCLPGRACSRSRVVTSGRLLNNCSSVVSTCRLSTGSPPSRRISSPRASNSGRAAQLRSNCCPKLRRVNTGATSRRLRPSRLSRSSSCIQDASSERESFSPFTQLTRSTTSRGSTMSSMLTSRRSADRAGHGVTGRASRLLNKPITRHRPDKRPRSNARSSAVVEPVSSRPAKCHPSAAAGLDRRRWRHFHDTSGVPCHCLLSQSGGTWTCALRVGGNRGAFAEWCPAWSRPALFLADPDHNTPGHQRRPDAVSGRHLQLLPNRSAVVGYGCRVVLARHWIGGSPQLRQPSIRPRVCAGAQCRCPGDRPRSLDRDIGRQPRPVATGLWRGSDLHGQRADSDQRWSTAGSAADTAGDQSEEFNQEPGSVLVASVAAGPGGECCGDRNPCAPTKRTTSGPCQRRSGTPRAQRKPQQRPDRFPAHASGLAPVAGGALAVGTQCGIRTQPQPRVLRVRFPAHRPVGLEFIGHGAGHGGFAADGICAGSLPADSHRSRCGGDPTGTSGPSDGDVLAMLHDQCHGGPRSWREPSGSARARTDALDCRLCHQPGRSSINQGVKTTFPSRLSGALKQPVDTETGGPGCFRLKRTPHFIEQPVEAELTLFSKRRALNQNIGSRKPQACPDVVTGLCRKKRSRAKREQDTLGR